MEKKWLSVLSIIALIIVSVVFVFMIWNFSIDKDVAEQVGCVDVNNVASFTYDLCYDAYTKNMFLTVGREYDNYKLRSFEFSFFDFNQQSYKISDIPDVGKSKSYKIPSEKNPQDFYVKLKIIRDFSSPICEEPRKLFVEYCPTSINDEGVSVSINSLNSSGLEDFVAVAEPLEDTSDALSLSLVEKEAIWKSQCESKWKCAGWGACIDGIRKRICEDLKKCNIPTDVPKRVQYCDGTCEENWECSWSACSGGFITPTCKDLNECGTSYTVPQKLNCNKDKKCISNIICGDWENCDVNYNFIDLIQDSISEIQGTKTRTCEDLNGCVQKNIEYRACSVNVDVYTKRFVKCGVEFIGVYNRLNDELLSRVSSSTGEASSLRIYLDDEINNTYCDYCSDGIKNGDEEDVDCGGTCEECSEVYIETTFRKGGWWENFLDRIKKIFV